MTFEAKDLKMCPRGQGRPRGLHLCQPISTIQSSRARRALTCAVTERLESTKRGITSYHVIFQACLKHSYVPSA